jgi:iron(III) transport system substrate-binding protein
MMRPTRLVFCLLFLGMMALLLPARADGVVNVYSYRQPPLVQPLFDLFTKETGIAVRMVFSDKGLIERLEQEGELSPADVLLTSDVARLVEAADKGLAQAVDSTVITDAMPASLRSGKNLWFGLTMRARVVYASVARVPQTEISYEELADPKWKGKICTRPGDHPYNLGLIAAMIAKRGDDATRAWLLGVKANLAVRPSGDDRAQAKSIFAGECDLALGNTYYMGLMLTNTKDPEQKDWAKASRILFPSSKDMGTNVNISGMALTAHAPHRENALKLMEFLAGDEAQSLYAAQNFEYPVNPKVPASDIVKAWGGFTPEALNLEDMARNQKRASKLVQETRFNDGP